MLSQPVFALQTFHPSDDVERSITENKEVPLYVYRPVYFICQNSVKPTNLWQYINIKILDICVSTLLPMLIAPHTNVYMNLSIIYFKTFVLSKTF
jgi:hypothetical protein